MNPDTAILERKTSEIERKPEAAPKPLPLKNPNAKRIRVIGVPLDLGQSRRGVDMGPSAVRVAGLEARLEAIGHVVEDAGNVAVAIAEQKKEGQATAKYLKEITATCTKHAELVVKTLEAAKIPLILGGDHYVAAGSMAGVAEFYRRQNQKAGLIWIDAHSDMNTPETSPSGNVHGMPLAAITGLGPPDLANILDFLLKSRRKIACWWACAMWTPQKKKIFSAPASKSLPCATLTSAACAPSSKRRCAWPGAAPPATTCRSTWIGSIRKMRPA